MQSMVKSVVLGICQTVGIKGGPRAPLLTYDVELTPSMWMLGGKIYPSRVMLTASWTSSGCEVVVGVAVAEVVVGVTCILVLSSPCRLYIATPSNCA